MTTIEPTINPTINPTIEPNIKQNSIKKYINLNIENKSNNFKLKDLIIIVTNEDSKEKININSLPYNKKLYGDSIYIFSKNNISLTSKNLKDDFANKKIEFNNILENEINLNLDFYKKEYYKKIENVLNEKNNMLDIEINNNIFNIKTYPRNTSFFNRLKTAIKYIFNKTYLNNDFVIKL